MADGTVVSPEATTVVTAPPAPPNGEAQPAAPPTHPTNPSSETGAAPTIPDAGTGVGVEDGEPAETGEQVQQVEELRAPEITIGTQREEFETVASTALNRAQKEALKKKAEGKPLSAGGNALVELKQFQDLADGDYNIQLIDPNKPPSPHPLKITLGSDAFVVDSITKISNGEVSCRIIKGDQIHPITVSAEAIINGHLLAEAEALKGLFPAGSEMGKLMDMHLQMLQAKVDVIDPVVPTNEADKATKRAENSTNAKKAAEDALEASGVDANSMIKGAASEISMFTVDDLKELGGNLGLEQTQIDAITGLTKGNILSAESFDQAMRATGLGPTEIATQVKDLNRQIAELRAVAPNAPEIKELEEQKQLLENFSKLYKGPLKDFFKNLQSGEISQEAAKGFIEAFRSGQIDETDFQKFGEEFPSLQRQPGESVEAWKARMQKGLGIAGIIALMLFMTTTQLVGSAGGGSQH